jgi:hypothetical protein
MRKMQSLGWGVVVMALVALLCSVHTAWGQDVTATITGTVTDQKGAAVPAATVTAKDTERGTVWTAPTNEAGVYSLLRLPVGTYDLKVEANGFQTAVHKPFTLVLNQTARIDVQLKVGTVTETVEVTGGAPVLQTDTTEIGTIIDARTNDNLALATRNPTQLTLLSPGAVTVDAASFNYGSNTAESGGRPYINGNREQANNFLLDGVDNNQISDNIIGYTPSPDAIQEFNLITQNASAEFGNYMGGIVNTTIKSGTNSYHGDVYEFFRNDVMNANQWENKIDPSNPISTPKLRWNMFGGTFGGPILKNKLFFFADYQGGRFDFPSTTKTIKVLSNAQRQGDFSSLLTAPTPVQLMNPCAAGTGVSGTPCQLAANPAPFAGNIIPTNMLDPVFTKLVSSSLYPAVVAPGPGGFALANNTINTLRNSDQEDVKIDYNLSEKDRFFGRYSQSKQNDPTSNSVKLLGNSISLARLYTTAVGWTHTISPSLLNEAHFGENRIYYSTGVTTFDSSVGALGNTLGINDGNPAGLNGLVNLSFGGGTITNSNTGTLTNLGNALILQNFQSAALQFSEGLIYTRGRHTTKVGFQFNRYRIDVFYSGNAGALGSIIYDPARYAGDAGANFALGLPSYVGRGVSKGGWHQRDSLIAGYVQDDWRATNNLTLNLGLRYEARTPWIETNNRQNNVDITTGQIVTAGGGNGYNNGLYKSVYGWPDFQPRIGFAWTPAAYGGKTVVRGAYSVSSYLEGTGTNLRLTQNPPFTPAQTEGANVIAAGGTPFTTAAGSIAASSPVAGNPYGGTLMEAWDKTVQPAIAQQWNLSIQREIAPNTTVQIGYVGQSSSHLMVPEWLTQGVLQANGTVAPSPYLGGPHAPTVPCPPPNQAKQCPNDPVSPVGGWGPNQIGQVKLTASVGQMRYNALQAVLQKRYGHGLETQVSYTYSKCMTNNSGYFGTWSGTTGATPASPYWQNLYNQGAEWAQCYYDSKHILSAYALYELPVGRGKQFGKDLPSAVNAVVGNWSVNPVVSWRTGFPFALYASDNSGTGSQGARPNCLGAPIYLKTGSKFGLQWVSPVTFSQPTSGFGNCPAQGPVVGPGYADVDMSLHKDFQFGEVRKFQFRAEFLNLFNHPNFAKMDNTVGDANFGLITQTQDARQIQLALKFYF